MNHVRWALAGLVALLGAAAPAAAEWSIGINLSSCPQLVPVPGYPVSYAPGLGANYFFYDGRYWVYAQDGWYASSWYNGPWDLVDPYYVAPELLKVPVSFYQRPPVYFSGWRADAPPRWAEHWGDGWTKHRADWNRSRRGRMPYAAISADDKSWHGEASYSQGDVQPAFRERNSIVQIGARAATQAAAQARAQAGDDQQD
jgi:hypothetical protein